MFSFRFDQPVLVLPDGLEYNEYNDIFRIPNKEVSQEYVNALSTMNWHGVTASDIQKSPMHERKSLTFGDFLYPKSTLALRCTSFSIIFKRFGGRL